MTEQRLGPQVARDLDDEETAELESFDAVVEKRCSEIEAVISELHTICAIKRDKRNAGAFLMLGEKIVNRFTDLLCKLKQDGVEQFRGSSYVTDVDIDDYETPNLPYEPMSIMTSSYSYCGSYQGMMMPYNGRTYVPPMNIHPYMSIPVQTPFHHVHYPTYPSVNSPYNPLGPSSPWPWDPSIDYASTSTPPPSSSPLNDRYVGICVNRKKRRLKGFHRGKESQIKRIPRREESLPSPISNGNSVLPDAQPVVIVTRNCDCKKKVVEGAHQTSSGQASPRESKNNFENAPLLTPSDSGISETMRSFSCFPLNDENEFPPLDEEKLPEQDVQEKRTFSEVAVMCKQVKPVNPVDFDKKTTKKKNERAIYQKKPQLIGPTKLEPPKPRPKEGWQVVTRTRSRITSTPRFFYDEKDTLVSPISPESELELPLAAEAFFQQYVDYLDNLASSEQDEELDKFERSKGEERNNAELVLYPDTCCVASFEAFILEHPVEAESLQKDLGIKMKQFKLSEVKQEMAQQKRKQIVDGKTAKARDIIQKVEEVKAAKTRLAIERKTQIFEKLKKAEEKRNKYLSYIRKKAHNEEEKLKEIAFINELEAQNRRHDSLALRQEHEERLQCILDGRQKRIEEKAAKEAAAEERRRAIEIERQEKLQKIAEERKIKEEKIESQHEKRLVLAKEKARLRDDRLVAIKCKSALKNEQLEKKIFKKHEDAAGRHDQVIEQKRMRASASGIHKNEESPLVEDSGAQVRTNDEDIKFPKKLDKKELKKLKLRISKKSVSYLNSLPEEIEPIHPEIQVILQKIAKQTPVRARIDLISKFLDKLRTSLKTCETPFFDGDTDGFKILCSVIGDLSEIDERRLDVLNQAFEVLFLVLRGKPRSVTHLVNSNHLITILNAVNRLLEDNWVKDDKWACVTVEGVAVLNEILNTLNTLSENPVNRCIVTIDDVIKFIVNCGVVDKIMIKHRENITINRIVPEKLHTCFQTFFKIFITKTDLKSTFDCVKQTDCFNCVRCLYEAVQRCDVTESVSVTELGINYMLGLLYDLAEHNFSLFKDVMAVDGAALQFRGVLSTLLSFATAQDQSNFVLLLVKLIGLFALCSNDYKVLLQSGNQPTVLNQLVTIPFKYIATHMLALYIALYILGSEEETNREIIGREFSFESIKSYIGAKLEPKDTLSSLTKQLYDKHTDAKS